MCKFLKNAYCIYLPLPIYWNERMFKETEMNIYDFDKTIYDGDSTADFYFYSLKRHPSVLTYLPKLIGGFIKYYILKKGNKTDFKEKMYSFLLCCHAEEEVNDFWDKHVHKIKEWYFAQQRPDDIIISASPEFLLAPLCKRLNINYLIASKVDSKTGKYTGINCHGEEKVRRLKDEYNISNCDAFYSDSHSDTPLAKIAKKSYMVKGNYITKWL